MRIFFCIKRIHFVSLIFGAIASFALTACSEDESTATAEVSLNTVAVDDVNKTEKPSIQITFVGTGGPEITPQREGIATLVSAGSQHLLVDAGRNVMQNLYEAGHHPLSVKTIFLSHLHNDHIEGLPPLWMTGWFLLGRDAPLEIVGPVGTQAMVDGMYAMFWFDRDKRADAFNKGEYLNIHVTEIDARKKLTPIFERDGVSVSALLVEHGDGNPAIAYKFNYDAHSVFITGDTTLTPELKQYARDVDALVSNVLAMPHELAIKPEMATVVAKLMTVENAAALFNATQPKLGVYTHFVTKDLPTNNIDGYIEDATREHGYTGPLYLAKDGWRLDIPSMQLTPPPAVESLPHMDRKKSYVDE